MNDLKFYRWKHKFAAKKKNHNFAKVAKLWSKSQEVILIV